MSDKLRENQKRIAKSPSYRLAERDLDFLACPELRPLRLQLELQKPEMAFIEHGIESTIVVFGGTQVVDAEEANERLAAAEKALDENPDDKPAQRARDSRAARRGQSAHVRGCPRVWPDRFVDLPNGG